MNELTVNPLDKDIQRGPILWALGRKGYMVQFPLLVALNEHPNSKNLNILGVTSNANIYLQHLQDSKQLLSVLDIPVSAITVFHFFMRWHSIRVTLVELLKRHASIVHVCMLSPWDIFFLSAAKEAGCTLLVTIHDAKQHLGEESYFMDKFRKWAISKADHVAVLSHHVAQTLKNEENFLRPIHVIEDGLVMRVEPALQPRKYPANGSMRLLFHGRIHAYKGLDLLLDAMLLLREQGCQYPLTIAGTGDLTPFQDKLALVQNLHVYNKFMSDSELLQFLEMHDVALLPYLEASQSAVAIDALWAALPSVATPVGALPKQFKSGIDALIIESVSAVALSNSILRLGSDAILYESLSLGAYNSYQTAGPRMAAKQWLSLYSDINVDN
jgi:glycosyltransferase involved in cell wall biosynthesis